MTNPNYTRIAKRAIPVKADCYDCDATWTGPVARDVALMHNVEKKHAVWIECKPHPEDGPV